MRYVLNSSTRLLVAAVLSVAAIVFKDTPLRISS